MMWESDRSGGDNTGINSTAPVDNFALAAPERSAATPALICASTPRELNGLINFRTNRVRLQPEGANCVAYVFVGSFWGRFPQVQSSGDCRCGKAIRTRSEQEWLTHVGSMPNLLWLLGNRRGLNGFGAHIGSEQAQSLYGSFVGTT
jgi:hypothetical protein